MAADGDRCFLAPDWTEVNRERVYWTLEDWQAELEHKNLPAGK